MTERRNLHVGANRRPGDENIRRRRRFCLLALAGAIVVAAAVTGLAVGYDRLSHVYHEQCRVSDVELDVVVSTGAKMVQPEVVTMHFGLTNGANLAEIDFAAKREELLQRVPNIKELRIERRMPNRVTIEVVERDPIARVEGPKRDGLGRVADAEGVVFRFMRGVGMLPLVREHRPVRVKPGERLAGMEMAALELAKLSTSPEFSSLGVLEVSADKDDCVTVTLGDYSRARVAWERMDAGGDAAARSLKRQLTRLQQAIRSNVAGRVPMWYATDYGTPGRIFAHDPARNAARKENAK